jgi:hypothetical protein
VKESVKSLFLSPILASSVGGCVAPGSNSAGPAWYCTGTAIVGGVQGFSTANLNADGTVNQAMREWNWPSPPSRASRPLSVTELNEQVWISVLGVPKDYYKNVDRVEIRSESIDNPQRDPSLVRDEPHNGSNAYVFGQDAFKSHKGRRAFFVALQRDGRVWWSLPLDLSIIDQGERAMDLADAQLALMRADFKKRCGTKEKLEGLVIM